MTTEKLVVTTSSIINDLNAGYTRTPKSKRYKGTGQSISEKYQLTPGQLKTLFNTPVLKGKRTTHKADFPFQLVDDVTKTIATPTVTDVPIVIVTTPRVEDFDLTPQF